MRGNLILVSIDGGKPKVALETEDGELHTIENMRQFTIEDRSREENLWSPSMHIGGQRDEVISVEAQLMKKLVVKTYIDGDLVDEETVYELEQTVRELPEPKLQLTKGSE